MIATTPTIDTARDGSSMLDFGDDVRVGLNPDRIAVWATPAGWDLILDHAFHGGLFTVTGRGCDDDYTYTGTK